MDDYRNVLRRKLKERIQEETDLLVQRHSDDVSGMRLRQGVIAGLMEAIAIADDEYRQRYG